MSVIRSQCHLLAHSELAGKLVEARLATPTELKGRNGGSSVGLSQARSLPSCVIPS